jgi:periplasmic protein TonB
MDFFRKHQPQRHLIGLSFVIVLHVAIVYALANGLGTKVIAVINQPIETKIIEETKPPSPREPPPPPQAVVPPSKPQIKPPVFVPAPEVQVPAPPPVQAPIAATTPTPALESAPVAPPAVAETPAPVTTPPPVMSAAVVCTNYARVMGQTGFPREALRLGLETGEALIQFTLSANGEVKDIKSLRASHPVFARNSMRIVSEYKCVGQGREVIVQVPFGYKLE